MGLFIVELMIDRLLEILTKTASVLRSFSPLSSSITRPDLNLALKFLLCLDMLMNPLFHTDFSISDSLKSVRKSVLIYETIIMCGFNKMELIVRECSFAFLKSGIYYVCSTCLSRIDF